MKRFIITLAIAALAACHHLPISHPMAGSQTVGNDEVERQVNGFSVNPGEVADRVRSLA